MPRRLLALALALTLCACAPLPLPTPDAQPDAAAEAAADAQSAPDADPPTDAAMDASDAAELPDAQPEASAPDVVDAGARDSSGSDASDAGPSLPPLTYAAEELQYWVLYESYPDDGRGSPIVRSMPLSPSARRVANGMVGDQTVFAFQSCATTGPNGCESVQLTQVPRTRVCSAGVCTDVPESNEICANPAQAGVPPNCSGRAVTFASSPTYLDRLGRRRMNFCWSASLAANPSRLAIWAIRGVAGRTTDPARGDFCVFGYPVP